MTVQFRYAGTKKEAALAGIRAGKHYSEIAREIGSTMGSVKSLVSRMRKEDPSIPRRFNRLNNVSGDVELVVRLPAAVVSVLQTEATARSGANRTHTGNAMAATILALVVKDDLFAAILGDLK